MSRHNKRKKAKQAKFQGTKITSVVIDELNTTQAGLWADPEPKHTKPEPVEEPTYHQGGILNQFPGGIGVMGDSRTPGGYSLSSDGLHPSMSAMEKLREGLKKIANGAVMSSEAIDKIRTATRNIGPITV